jgi:hypothetical protein
LRSDRKILGPLRSPAGINPLATLFEIQPLIELGSLLANRVLDNVAPR